MLSDDSSYFTGMMLSVVADLSQLEDGIQPCETCCEGTAVHCPLCPTTLFKPTDREKVVNHLKTHWHTRVQSLDGDSSLSNFHRSLLMLLNTLTGDRTVVKHISAVTNFLQYRRFMQRALKFISSIFNF